MTSEFASDTDLFVEVFPIQPEAVPDLTAYSVSTAPESADRADLGGRLAARFRKVYGGLWRWLDDHLVTDTPHSAVELSITADMLKQEFPDRYGGLVAISELPDWRPSAGALAALVLREKLRPLRGAMQAALSQAVTRLHNASIERDHRLQAWDVAGSPALSITIASRMIYGPDAAAFIAALDTGEGPPDKAAVNERLGGLSASDKTSPVRGEITGVAGQLGPMRRDLLDIVASEALAGLILAAPDDEWVLRLRAGQDEFTYPASALRLVVRVGDLGRFDLDRATALEALQMQPQVRAGHVRAVSDIAKQAGLIDSAYNSRSAPQRFLNADVDLNLRYGERGGVSKRVRPYRPQTLADDFAQCGAYRVREPFGRQPLRICVVNTLSLKLADFVEAMQRAISRSFDFSIEIVRERQVRVVSRANLESAIRVVEKEDPDIILAFFPDEGEDDASSDDDDGGDEGATAAYVRSLTLGRALPIHIIRESTLDDPSAMTRILLSVLGKTGSAPFVLAEPVEGVDRVVGLALVRDHKKTSGETRLIAIARVYRADGEFVRYVARDQVQAAGEAGPPYVLVRDLFPQREYAGQRVVIHHDGPLPDDLGAALAVWAQAIGATFYPVLLHRIGAPRLYGLERGVSQPPWGSGFTFNEHEALLVSHVPEAEVTPQPLRVETQPFAGAPAFPIREALRGVLVWSLLAYGAKRPPKLPVTVVNTDQLAYWLRRGNTFTVMEGRVPFWL